MCYKINMIISIQHPWIISKSILDAVDGFAFNIHFGKLPEYRGHHLGIHSILNGEKTFTTTCHWMAQKEKAILTESESEFMVTE